MHSPTAFSTSASAAIHWLISSSLSRAGRWGGIFLGRGRTGGDGPALFTPCVRVSGRGPAIFRGVTGRQDAPRHFYDWLPHVRNRFQKSADRLPHAGTRLEILPGHVRTCGGGPEFRRGVSAHPFCRRRREESLTSPRKPRVSLLTSSPTSQRLRSAETMRHRRHDRLPLPLLPRREERAGERRAGQPAGFARPPLSLTLSPLVPRKEREPEAQGQMRACGNGTATHIN
jgi:hypothetical protein